jgi:hypothetical protein
MKSCTLLLLKKNIATGEMLYGVEEYLCHYCRPKEWPDHGTVLIGNLQIDILE